jgi:hypothetical protein
VYGRWIVSKCIFNSGLTVRDAYLTCFVRSVKSRQGMLIWCVGFATLLSWHYSSRLQSCHTARLILRLAAGFNLPWLEHFQKIPLTHNHSKTHNSGWITVTRMPHHFPHGNTFNIVQCLTTPGGGIAQWYSAGLRAGWSEVRDPAGAGKFSLHHRVQTGSGAHPAWIPGALSLGVKRQGHEANHSPPF